MKKILTIIGLAAATLAGVNAQLVIGTLNSANTQNFDSLASSGTAQAQTGGIFASTVGWSFLEGGANANTTYDAGTGSNNAGNTYSFGVAGTNAVTDRALGMLQSGSLTSILGFKFTNSTGSTITSLNVAFRGETWRLATAADTLAFSYQVADVALNAASGWTAVSALNYTSVTGTAAASDGNASGRFTSLSNSITGLSIANGTTVTFRWVDSTGSSSAGMAIDDFSLTAVPEPQTWVMIGIGTSFMLWNLRRRRRVQG